MLVRSALAADPAGKTKLMLHVEVRHSTIVHDYDGEKLTLHD